MLNLLMPTHTQASPRLRDVHGAGARALWLAGMVKDLAVYVVLMIGSLLLYLGGLAVVLGCLVLIGVLLSAIF